MTIRPYWVDFQAVYARPGGHIGAFGSATAGYVHMFTNGDVGRTSFNMTAAEARKLAELLAEAAYDAEVAAIRKAAREIAVREGISR